MSAAKLLHQALKPVVGTMGEMKITTRAMVTAFPPDTADEREQAIDAEVVLDFVSGACTEVRVDISMTGTQANGTRRGYSGGKATFQIDPDALPALAAALSAAVDRAFALNLQGRVDALDDPIEFSRAPQRVARA